MNHNDLQSFKGTVDECIVDGELICSVPEKIFIFKQYQAEQFWFFICDGSDDPMVGFMEVDEEEIIFEKNYLIF